MSNTACVLKRSRNCLLFARAHEFTPIFDEIRFAQPFRLLCCPVMCIYALSSVLWCPLRVLPKNNDRFVFTSSSLQGRMSCLCYLYLVVYNSTQHILCCVFVLFFFVLCTLSCQFIQVLHLYCPFDIF
jgi:hypothetical protein